MKGRFRPITDVHCHIMRIGHLLVYMYGAKHTVPVAHIVIVSTLGNSDRDALAGSQLVANVRVSGVGGIF